MSEILFEQQGPVGHIWLNRPELSNAFNDSLITSLTRLLQQLDTDSSVRVVVLGGKGKHFCAGADMNWMRSMAGYSEAENRTDAGNLAGLLQTLNNLSKPVIGRCQGAAFGGGVGLLACCDIVIASDQSLFCLSEVRLGLTPATISPYVIQAIGARQARRYFLTADRFDGSKAAYMGLVSEVVEAEQLDDAIAAQCQLLLQGGPRAISEAKQLIAEVDQGADFDNLKQYTIDLIARQRVGTEGQEGLTAFLNKRKPEWLS